LRGIELSISLFDAAGPGRAMAAPTWFGRAPLHIAVNFRCDVNRASLANLGAECRPILTKRTNI
jgi:hypothetical protein